jgi:UDP-glucose 4-epimerase
MTMRNEYKGRSVLITGGLGFIGSNLAHRLVEFGDVEVIILDALMPDEGGNLFNIHGIEDRVKVHHADMGDDYVANHLVGGVDYIFNLAGQVSHLESLRHPHRDLEMNCAAQLTMLEACRNYNPHVKIVFASTRQVYGRPFRLPVRETHRVAPLDINGVHKLAAEHYHLLYNRLYGTRAVCLRLTNTYGPRQLIRHNRQGFIAWFVRQALEGSVIELYGEGRQKRDLNYVDDVVDALLLAGASERAEGEIFNLGGGDPVALSEIASELIGLTGRGSMRLVPFPPEQQLIEIGNCYLSCHKIEAALGWHPRTKWQEGLARTVDYYRAYLDEYLKPQMDPLPVSNAAAQGD